jgi:aryl-alcohol dehydrogenase-like predicted oxidoreductase
MNYLAPRPFGNTGINVSPIGYGAGHIGDPSLNENDVRDLLNTIVDSGITLIDSARGYGLSEERIGKHLAHRRKEIILSTKIGYGIPGYEDWTGPCITAGIDAALTLLRTDYIDIVHFHSCPIDTLHRNDLFDALNDAVSRGKVRVPAYSGDNEHLDFAISTGNVRSIQTSVNITDQKVLAHGIAEARRRNLGVIAKRPVANAPWRFAELPAGHYCEEYWQRLKIMNIDTGGMSWQELAIRFVAFLPGVHSSIIGTTSIDHLKENLRYVELGPLPENITRRITQAFAQHGSGWVGLT